MGDGAGKKALPRVVILGGGVAGMTAAMELSRPGWQQRYESITLYQLGWRLGGKGASGRGAHERIEEHGLHIWLGFYDNAFRLLREGVDALSDVVPDLVFFGHLVEMHAPMLLLKQFRDAHVPGAACYQALVLVDLKVLEFRDGGLLPDDYEVTIERLDGEPIARELGVAESGRPRIAFWLDFDFLVELGDILWEAPVG